MYWYPGQGKMLWKNIFMPTSNAIFQLNNKRYLESCIIFAHNKYGKQYGACTTAKLGLQI